MFSSLQVISLHNQATSTDMWLKWNPIMSGNFISTKILRSWCKLTWYPCDSTKSCWNERVARREHLLTCCFVCEAQSAAWLTFDVPFDLTAVLRAQSLVQLLHDYFQLADLSCAGQRYLFHIQMHVGQPGWRNQKTTEYHYRVWLTTTSSFLT